MTKSNSRVKRVKGFVILDPKNRVVGFCERKTKPFAGFGGRNYLTLPKWRKIIHATITYTLPTKPKH